MPQVSAIITTYNRAGFLPMAISSVLNQTHQDFELLVVDDCSSDHTGAVVASFKDDRIRYVRHDVNQGESGARNTGIAKSSGRYIAFLDDDDEWLPAKLQSQIERMKQGPEQLGVVSASYLRVRRSDGQILGRKMIADRGNLLDKLRKKNCVGAPSVVLIKRECFQTVGLFDEGLRSLNDYDMWIRIARNYLFDSIEQPLAKYYIHEQRVSTNPQALIQGVDRLLEKYGDFPIRKYLSHSVVFAGISFCETGDKKKSRQAFVKALRLAPDQPKHYLIFALSLLGPTCLRKIRQIKTRLLRSE
jgi:glycosyltransferase involved in cell wall biosynthesis